MAEMISISKHFFPFHPHEKRIFHHGADGSSAAAYNRDGVRVFFHGRQFDMSQSPGTDVKKEIDHWDS